MLVALSDLVHGWCRVVVHTNKVVLVLETEVVVVAAGAAVHKSEVVLVLQTVLVMLVVHTVAMVLVL